MYATAAMVDALTAALDGGGCQADCCTRMRLIHDVHVLESSEAVPRSFM